MCIVAVVVVAVPATATQQVVVVVCERGGIAAAGKLIGVVAEEGLFARQKIAVAHGLARDFLKWLS